MSYKYTVKSRVAQNHCNVNGDFSAGVGHDSGQMAAQLHATSLVRREITAITDWIKASSFVLSASIIGGTA